MENKDKPAYPDARSINRMDGNGYVKEFYAGLTKREYFAGLALQGVLAGGLFTSVYEAPMMAVEYADALLKVLEQDQPQKAS